MNAPVHRRPRPVPTPEQLAAMLVSAAAYRSRLIGNGSLVPAGNRTDENGLTPFRNKARAAVFAQGFLTQEQLNAPHYEQDEDGEKYDE